MASEVRFAEVRKLLQQHGYALVRISGSHHIFEKVGGGHIPNPVHGGKVKPVYVRQIQKIVEED